MELKKILRVVLFWVGIGFISWLAFHSWGEIQSYLSVVDWFLFGFSVVVAVLSNVVISAIFWNLLLKHNVDVSYLKTIRLFFTAQIAKYIPGKVWVIAHQVSSIQKEGVVLGVAMANIELMMILVVMSLLSSAILYAFITSFFFVVPVLFIGGFIVWFFIKYNFLGLVLRVFSRFERKNRKENECGEMAFGFLGIAFCYVVFVILYIASYLLMLYSVFGFSFDESVLYIISLSLAWVVGLVAFVVPGGVGVREVLFIATAGLIGQGVEVEVLVSIAVISRVWLMMQEVVGVAGALLIPDGKIKS